MEPGLFVKSQCKTSAVLAGAPGLIRAPEGQGLSVVATATIRSRGGVAVAQPGGGVWLEGRGRANSTGFSLPLGQNWRRYSCLPALQGPLFIFAAAPGGGLLDADNPSAHGGPALMPQGSS